MAEYHGDLVVPPNTPEYSPVEITIRPGAGFLRGGEVIFPRGCLGAIHVRLLDYGSQIFPVTGWLQGDGVSIPFTVGRRLQGAPYRLVVQGWSTAIDWTHTITIRAECVI